MSYFSYHIPIITVVESDEPNFLQIICMFIYIYLVEFVFVTLKYFNPALSWVVFYSLSISFFLII